MEEVDGHQPSGGSRSVDEIGLVDCAVVDHDLLVDVLSPVTTQFYRSEFLTAMVSIDFTKKWDLSDVALKMRDSEELLYANKAVLAVHSPFFNSLLFGDYAESKQDVVNLDGIDYRYMLEILKVLHHVDRKFDGSCTKYFLEELIQLWQIADGYDIALIRDLCRQRIGTFHSAKALETAIKWGFQKEKTEILVKMKHNDIQEYLKKGGTELVLTRTEAAIMVRTCTNHVREQYELDRLEKSLRARNLVPNRLRSASPPRRL